MNCKLLVCCHKPCEVPVNDFFLPIQVGKALSDIDLGFTGDDTGDNISTKNKEYCEITAVYWAWKNLKNVDIIGLNHYRRFFDLKNEAIEGLLKTNDVILPRRKALSFNNMMEFHSFVTRENSMIFLDILIKLYPSYKQNVIDFFYNSNKWSRYNMFIAKWNIFDDFCNFMFPILFEMEKIVIPSGYSRINRVYGYVAETLWSLYVLHNHLKVKYVDFIRTDHNNSLSTLDKFKESCHSLRKNVSFYLSHSKRFTYIPLYDSVIVGLRNDGIKIDLKK